VPQEVRDALVSGLKLMQAVVEEEPRVFAVSAMVNTVPIRLARLACREPCAADTEVGPCVGR
jgi:hypothetical protein